MIVSIHICNTFSSNNNTDKSPHCVVDFLSASITKRRTRCLLTKHGFHIFETVLLTTNCLICLGRYDLNCTRKTTLTLSSPSYKLITRAAYTQIFICRRRKKLKQASNCKIKHIVHATLPFQRCGKTI